MQQSIIIPNDLYCAIDQLDYKSKVTRSNCIKICTYLFKRHLNYNIPFNEMQDITYLHFRKNICHRYKKPLNILIDKGIVISDNKYYNLGGLGRCKKYQINNDLLYSDPIIINIDSKLSSKYQNTKIVKRSVRILSKIKVSIGKREIAKFIKSNYNYSYFKKIIFVNDQIPGGKYKINKSNYYLDLDKIKNKYHQYDLVLYKNKIHVCKNHKAFINEIVVRTQYTYMHQLLRLKGLSKRVNLNCNRNTTNHRLDTNITNLKSDFLQLIQINNSKLVSIDLKNSQFTILSAIISTCTQFKELSDLSSNNKAIEVYFNKWIENNPILKILNSHKFNDITYFDIFYSITKDLTKSKDLDKFMTTTKQGVFYEAFAEMIYKERYSNKYKQFKSFKELDYLIQNSKEHHIQFAQKTFKFGFSPSGRIVQSLDKLKAIRAQIRKDAKEIMFLTSFSSHRYNPKTKQLLKKSFPSLVLIMDQVKKLTNEKNSLAIILQTVEARIIIDDILSNLLDKGYLALSKHDSIICRQPDAAIIGKLILSRLNKYIGYNCYQITIDKY